MKTVNLEKAKKNIGNLKNQIEGLQSLVTFLEDKPELAENIYVYGNSFSVQSYCYDNDNKEAKKDKKKEFSLRARLLSRGTKLTKEYTDHACKVVRKFSDKVSIEVSINREAVCERIVKEIIEHPARLQEAWKEEVVEWKCK